MTSEDPVERAAELRGKRGTTSGNSNAPENAPDGGAENNNQGGECPLCGDEYDRDLPAHLAGECGA